MGRQADDERLQQISDCVKRHPGIRPAEIARQLDLPRSSVTRALPAPHMLVHFHGLRYNRAGGG